jgi:hypothetical protein
MDVINDIVGAIAADRGLDPTELPPLYDSIDPDVVNAFVESADEDASLEFQYYDTAITVSGSGVVETRPVTEPALVLD